MIRHDFNDGKYTVINDGKGNLTALRYGEPWKRDLVGDQLVASMLYDYDAVLKSRAVLIEALKELAVADGSIENVSHAEVMAARVRIKARFALATLGIVL